MRILRLLPLLAAACAKPQPPSVPDLATHEGVTDAHIAAMDDMIDVLDGIRDARSAEAARPRMEAIAKRMREVNEAEAQLPPAAPGERTDLDARLEAAARRLEPQFRMTMERLEGDSEALVLVAQMMIDATFETRR